ncbi:ABC transporter ATP-binding protein [Paenibacillus koleovorans]|uniref:ABC transporter ATP-binding protein n=1 Tax=Paenibacillus koleovorans TaxID=121608 RepID=UPI0015804A35|nr:ABC transporter ATP-binding protein [Paenibacillus koleovorans]
MSWHESVALSAAAAASQGRGGPAAVAVDQLRLAFPGADSLLFRDLSLSVSAREKVLLLGPSGCGKSTLLQVLTGLIPKSIEMPMRCGSQVVPASWGYVFQDPDTQFCMPYVDEELAFVLENLQVPREQMRGRIEELLRQVGLQLDDIHTSIQALSQGMKQRLAIACVLALQPDVWFVDEPTALLDDTGTKQVWDTLKSAAADKTLIIVEHKLEEIADYVDRVVVFNADAEIVADEARSVVFSAWRESLKADGIWVPGIWDDYLASDRYRDLMRERVAEKLSAGEMEELAGANESSRIDRKPPLIGLQDWTVYRGKQPKLVVEKAEVREGEWISIVGENGAGKSTLLLSLLQLLRASGMYMLLGQPIDRRHREATARELALVFQNPEFQFVTNSVQAEIAYTLRLAGASKEEIDRQTEAAMLEFDLAHRREHHPYQLSLGQKRRLSVAAAAVKHHRALLLDEPTFGQDARNTFAILEKLERHRRSGTTILIVTHDPHIVAHFSTRVWEIREGRLASDEPIERFDRMERVFPSYRDGSKGGGD